MEQKYLTNVGTGRERRELQTRWVAVIIEDSIFKRNLPLCTGTIGKVL